MSLKFYYDLVSEPARACMTFLKVTKIPFQPCPIVLRLGEQKSEAYRAVTPIQKVPVIDDNGFILTESNAILKYLARTRNVSSHWYPGEADPKVSARIEEYMNWQHLGLRYTCSRLFQIRYVAPRVKNRPPDFDKMEKYVREVTRSVDLLQNYFIDEKKFIASDLISVADILAMCELLTPYAVGFDVFIERPRLCKWRDRFFATVDKQYWDEINQPVYKVAAKFSPAQSKLPSRDEVIAHYEAMKAA